MHFWTDHCSCLCKFYFCIFLLRTYNVNDVNSLLTGAKHQYVDRIHITRSQKYHGKKSYFSTMILFYFGYCLFHQAFIVSITCVSSVSVIIYGTIAYMMFEKGLANTPFL